MIKNMRLGDLVDRIDDNTAWVVCKLSDIEDDNGDYNTDIYGYCLGDCTLETIKRIAAKEVDAEGSTVYFKEVLDRDMLIDVFYAVDNVIVISPDL